MELAVEPAVEAVGVSTNMATYLYDVSNHDIIIRPVSSQGAAKEARVRISNQLCFDDCRFPVPIIDKTELAKYPELHVG